MDRESVSQSQLDIVRHIRGLKVHLIQSISVKALSHLHSQDVKDLNLTVTKDDNLQEGNARFICPITNVPMNGSYRSVCIVCVGFGATPSHNNGRFAYFKGCGCVLSERAIREVPSENCHMVGLLHHIPFIWLMIPGVRKAVLRR